MVNNIRVLRGGSWGDFCRGCRSADRIWLSPVTRFKLYGFRVVRVLKLPYELPTGGSGFTFFIGTEPVIKLEKDAFWYKGEKVKDVNQVYERFSEWMAAASKIEAGENQVKVAVPDADASKGPQGPDSDTYRVLRGGSLFYDPRFCRSANRYLNNPELRCDYYGFRVVRVPRALFENRRIDERG